MAKSEEEKLMKLKAFAERTLENHRHPHIGEFFKRCADEEAPVFDPSYMLTEKTFYRAPRRRFFFPIRALQELMTPFSVFVGTCLFPMSKVRTATT